MAEVDSDTVARWVDHPIVRRAIEQAEPPTASRIVQHLICILNELETRFPGVPFDTILSAPTELSRTELTGTLRRAGVDERDIDRIVGRDGLSDRWPPFGDDQFQAVDRCETVMDLYPLGYNDTAARQLLRVRLPITELDEQILDVLFTGVSQRGAAELLGCDTRTVKTAYLKHRYRLWKDTR